MTTQGQKSPADRAALGRLDVLVLAGAFAIPFVVYVYTLMPSVAGGDSGELTAAAYCLGVAHAPGYPLYTLLLHAWQWLPIGTIAYRSNLFSAVTMAGMGMGLAWVYRMAGGSRPGALLAALASAFISITWSEATRTETYGLHGILVALTIGLFLRWERLRTGRSLVWLALAAGFALSHHRTSLFLLAPFLGLALVRHRPWTVGQAVKVAAALLAPFAVYAYLPLRAAANPPANWGDIRSWDQFVYHAMGKRAVFWIGFRPWTAWVKFFLGGTLVVPAVQMSVVGLGLVVLGAVTAVVKRRQAGLCALGGVVLLAGWNSSWGFGEVKWFIPVFMIYGLWLAAGVETAAAGVGRVATGARAEALPRMVRVAGLVVFPLILLSNNFAAENHRQEWGPYDWGRILFAEVGPNALVALSPDTPLLIAYYFKVVEQARPDVEVLGPTILPEAWVQRQLRDPAMKRLVREALATSRATTIEEWLQQWPPHVMGYVVRHYAERRPVYYDRPLTDLGPGYRTISHQTVYRFAADGPGFVKADGDAPLQGDFPPIAFGAVAGPGQGEAASVILAAAQSAERRVRPGELFRVRLAWRCEREVSERLEVLAFMAPEGATGDLGRELFAGGGSVPLVWGVLPLGPTAPGTHYEQQVWYVTPRGLTPGRYLVRVGLHAPEAERTAAPQPAVRLEVVR